MQISITYNLINNKFLTDNFIYPYIFIFFVISKINLLKISYIYYINIFRKKIVKEVKKNVLYKYLINLKYNLILKS